jgi:SAM-dependent methyltransferase
LIPHLRQRGVQDILAVDLSEHMLQALKARYGSKSTVGNEPGEGQDVHPAAQAFPHAASHPAVGLAAADALLHHTPPLSVTLPLRAAGSPHAAQQALRHPAAGVRTWLGDFTELPPFLGTADAILMNAVFGNFFSQREALIKASFLLKPGGHLVLSHPMGRAWHAGLRAGSPELVAHELPDQQALQEMVQDLPLQVASFTDDTELYNVLLQVGSCAVWVVWGAGKAMDPGLVPALTPCAVLLCSCVATMS